MLVGAAGLMTVAGGKIALDGQAVAMGAPALTASIVELCRQDKNVRAFMLSMTTGSAYANVAIAAMPIVIAILANHNLLPPILGISPVVKPEPKPTQQNGYVPDMSAFQTA